MKRKKCYRNLFIFLICFIFVACNEKEVLENDTMMRGEKKEIQIGMTFDSFVIERWQRDRDIFVSAAKNLGATVNVQTANGDPKEQITQVEYFIKKKMDVIVIIAVDSDNLSEVVEKAKKEGIKVIAYDRLIDQAGVDLYISFDNKEVGRMMAETMMDEMKDGKNLVMIEGPTTDHNVSMIYDGFMEKIKNNDVFVVSKTNAESWRAEVAFDYLNSFDSLDQIQGIMCGNDSLAGQAIRALSMQRLAGKITVVGQDADLEACQRIVEGTQAMTVYKPIEKLAKSAADCAVTLAKGEKITGGETISDGTNEIPYVKIQPIKVTKSNLDEVIIGGGFHLREEVYLNVTNDSMEN